MQNGTQRFFAIGAAVSLVALILLGVAWELVLAPLRPNGSWLVLKVVPLLFPLRGVLKRNIYTMQWASMLILLYFAEGIVRATSDTGMSATLGWVEAGIAAVFFFCTVLYLRPFKQAAKQLAKQAIQKASK